MKFSLNIFRLVSCMNVWWSGNIYIGLYRMTIPRNAYKIFYVGTETKLLCMKIKVILAIVLCEYKMLYLILRENTSYIRHGKFTLTVLAGHSLPWWWRQYVRTERRRAYIHGATSLKTAIFIVLDGPQSLSGHGDEKSEPLPEIKSMLLKSADRFLDSHMRGV